MIKETLIGIGSFLLGLMVPVLPILVGAGCIALGVQYEIVIVGWFGVTLAGAGVIRRFHLVPQQGGLTNSRHQCELTLDCSELNTVGPLPLGSGEARVTFDI